MSHRLSASAEVDGRETYFALLHPGMSEKRKQQLREGARASDADIRGAASFAADNPDYLRELDRGDSMRFRGGTLPLEDQPAPMKPKSNLPPGASLSPRGDLGYARQQESEMNTRKFKNAKSIRPSREMPVRNMQLPK